ncbi:PAS domain S-box protein [Pontibacter qinzhouensis]|uniref:histidine kinase n=1 Tax=Pontibacter qinzhouensis TaxID=2603253 RepID=A0A5C8IMV7_9BACT|nr:PAS domain S-box protein [Pontibacter qinzhouensis]TXK22570.1 PAS domain S-box protein [Pontibacter qinzhouensis]
MSIFSEGSTPEHLTNEAKNLLQVVTQLAKPGLPLLVADLTGQVLATNCQAHDLLSSDLPQPPPLLLQHILCSGKEEAFTRLVQELHQNRKFSSGIISSSPKLHMAQFKCQLLNYADHQFITVEIVPALENGSTLSEKDNYRYVFEYSTEPLFILDSAGNFIDINKTALRLINQRKEDLVGNSIFRSFGLNLFERVALRGQLNQAMSGTPQKFEWWLLEKSNDLLPIEILLQQGEFDEKEVIFGSARNLLELVGSEQEIRFRNHQLEFVNHLITNLSTSNSEQEVLNSTVEELLQKSDMIGGCVYNYSEADEAALLSYSAGKTTETNSLPESFPLSKELADQVLTPDKRFILRTICSDLEKQINQNLTLLPITTEKSLVALLVLWPEKDTKTTPSFLSLLEFIGNAIGNYLARRELMQQLIHSEDKYKMLFEASYDAILLFNNEGKIVDCNEKTTQLFRCNREDLLGASPYRFSPEVQPDGIPSDEKTAQLMKKALSMDAPVTFEWRNLRKDGTSFDAEITLNRIKIDGQYYVQAFKRDITQRKLVQLAKRREEVVNESMEHFRSFLEKVSLVYFSMDTEGTIVYSNDYFLKYLEYEREELIGKNYHDLLVPVYEREKRRQDFIRSIKNKQLNTYYERDLLMKSGQVKTLRWDCMFEYGPDGEIKGVTSVGKDMTDKRIAMEALKDNKIRLQDLFDNAHDLIQNISADNKFIFVNKAWKDRLGYNDVDIETLSLNDIVHPYYKAKLIYQLRNLYKGEHVNKIETVFLTKAGKPVHLIGSITCSWQDGKPVATRAILHDITDRIKAERLQKVYYSIANLAISSKDLNSLYGAIHRELSKIIETRNIYIALCDYEFHHLHFVYLVDQFIDKSTKTEIRRPFTMGLSEYIIKTGKPLYMQKQELIELAEKQKLTIHGALPEVILCSPLAIGDRIIGVITLQDYQNPDAYVHTDIEILHFISNQVALAIERKRNEEQINNQNARLKAIFESGTHHMWSINRQFELTSFNRNFSKTFSKPGEELTPFTSIEVVKPIGSLNNREDFWVEKYEHAFEGATQHFEISLADNSSWLEIYLNPIYLEDGTFEEISGIALDISDKKKSQLALANSEVKFRRIFESFQDVYYRTSLDGVIEIVSPSIFSLLGYKEEETIGYDSGRFFVHPAQRLLMRERVLQQGSVRDVEAQLICKDGTKKAILLDSRVIYDETGKPVSLEGVARDVSELKRTQTDLLKAKEEAENLLKVKTQFLANMSHELRTPMNGIIGMIDLLRQINTDKEQSEYIETLRKSSDALLAILNDILDLSKMQAGKLQISESGIDLYDTLGKIHSLFVNRAQQKDLLFIYTIEPGTPRYIFTDEIRFLQILSNLVSNAIKFTNQGEVSVFVKSRQLNKTEHMLHVRVKDSGIGISPEDQQVLFTDFMQVDNSSTKTFGGTGLGLAISKQITTLMGGSIGVESEPGLGSTFWFNIKIKLADADEVEAHIEQQQLSSEVEVFASAPYVLLVDDNQINQKVAEKQLERLGCRIDIASNGFEAITYATTNNYNIIFMDIQMPEMDGITAMKKIRDELGSYCPPIIAMTAYSMKDDAIKFIQEGMDDYVSKPVKSYDLYAVMSRWENSSWQNPDTATPAAEAKTELNPIAIIDQTVVEQLKQIGGPEFIKQLYADFEEEAAGLLQDAKKELEAQHYNGILSTLHQLKGTGFTLGINPLAELAKQLEHDIKNNVLEGVDDNFSKLLEQYEYYKKAYKEIII